MMQSSDCQVCNRKLEDGRHLCIVIPIYKSAAHIEALVDALNALCPLISGGLRAVFAIDGTPDSSEIVLNQHSARMQFPARIVRLSRNFGVTAAVHAGLVESSECVTVVVGSDLQEPPELIRQFFEEIALGASDVVIGERIERHDPLSSRFFSSIYWFVNRRVLKSDLPKGGFDVFGLSKRAKERLSCFRELNSNITSQVQWIGFPRTSVPYVRRARLSGRSSWKFSRKVGLVFDSVYGFSGVPIVAMALLGIGALSIFSLVGILTLIGVVLDLVQVRGYPTLILIVMIGFSAVISCLGIIGGYLVRTFENSKGRPLFIVEHHYDLNARD